MAVKPRIFVSTVSSEFGSTRQLVANILTRLGYDPVMQEILGTESGDLRQVLRDKIDSCDGLIQIVGEAYGAEPPIEDDQFRRLSYTQFEFDYAKQRGKETWLIIADTGCERDKPLDELDLPAYPNHSDARGYQAERRALQIAYRERLQANGHFQHSFSDTTQLELTVERLKDEFAGLRTAFRRWQRAVSVSIATMLVILPVIAGGVGWTVFWQPVATDPDSIAKKVTQAVTELADPEQIRFQIRKTINATYEREVNAAENLANEAAREEAKRSITEERDRRLAEIDEFIDSVVSTLSSGDVSVEFTRLTEILQDKGVDAALAYVDSQWTRLLREADDKVDDIERTKLLVRRKLQPGLKSVSLLRDSGEYESALKRCQELLAKEPTWTDARHEHVLTLINLADGAIVYDTLATAHGHYMSASVSAQIMAQTDPHNAIAQRDIAVVLEKLGDVSQESGDLNQALEYFRKSHETFEKLAADDPTNANAQHDLSVSWLSLGDASMEAGDLSQAVEYFRRYRTIVEKLTADDPTDATATFRLAAADFQFGDVGKKSGDLDRALEYYQKAHDTFQKLASTDPTNANAQRNLSASYRCLGDVSLQARDLKQALEYSQKSLDIAKKLAADDPSNVVLQRDLFASYLSIGDVRFESRRLNPALEYFQKSLEIAKKLAATDPTNARAQRDLHVLYSRLGGVMQRLGDLEQARDYFQEDLKIAKKLAESDPINAGAQHDLFNSYASLGSVNRKSGDLDQALEYLQKSLDIVEKLAADDPTNAIAQRNLVTSHYAVGELQQDRFAYAQAVNHYQSGIVVLKRMIAAGQCLSSLESQQGFLALLAVFIRASERKAAATANWDTVMAQSAEQLPTLLEIRCTEFAKQGRIDEVARAAAKLRSLEPKNKSNLYNAARALGLCVASIVDDEQQKQKFVTMALETLGEAIDAGYDSFSQMASEPDLASLRHLSEFWDTIEK